MPRPTNPTPNFAPATAWVEAWTMSVQTMFQFWGRLFDMQRDFMNKAEEHQRRAVEIAQGPSFLDRYGKRAHDIDPERDV